MGISRFCLLCLMFGLFTLGSLSAQGPGGGPPAEGDRGGGDRGGGRGGRGGGFGGRGGFDPAQMFADLDKDHDGVISASESEQMNGRMRERMQQGGTDFSKGVRVDELQQSMQRRMEERGGPGGGGPGGPEQSRERGGEFQRSDRPENPQPLPQPLPPGQGNGRDGRGDNRDSGPPGGGPTPGKSSSGSTSKKRATRISPLLPDAYKDLDSDYDGQIALYEWRKGKRGTISQFVQNDLDGDGFLIAKELAKAGVPARTTPTAPGAAPATVTTAAAAVAAPVAPAVPPAPVAVSVDAAAAAAGAFALLDQDKSGTVVGKEWDKSVRLKPLFEKGGVNLTQPLNLDAFTQAYVRVGAAKVTK